MGVYVNLLKLIFGVMGDWEVVIGFEIYVWIMS